ncbi:glycosyltransferase family 4 protein [uncultured Aeromicrobium sp.]|uniref:glycosyltransferase family 4 protein n=1 Tax=uncultured Aeromicrobium sp. TaxID=337820 RepID=UPI0025F8C822|nr:glycosyltransferase [uncultured Aeromicrobium sp.]
MPVSFRDRDETSEGENVPRTRTIDSEVVYVTTYDPSLMHLGGAAWIDQRMLNQLTAFTFVVCKDQDGAVPLEIRNDRIAVVRTLLRMSLLREPYIAAKFRWSSAWQRRAQDLRAVAQSGALIITSQWPALLLAHDAGVRPALHIAHNVDYRLAEEHDPRLFHLLGNADRTRRWELDLLALPKKLATLSVSDAELLRQHDLPAEHLQIAPDPVTPDSPPSRRGRVGFLGKASWPPNEEALRLLIDEVMPAVRADLDSPPELLVAGRGMERFAGDGVVSIGQVHSLDEFYDQVDLIAVPRLGVTSGVSVKMLEAVEQGIPVIAPAQLIADAGLRRGAAAADTAPQMAQAIVAFYRGEKAASYSPPSSPSVNSRPISQILQDVSA